eukprot:7584562-Pyramimonas_sp.AAC.1
MQGRSERWALCSSSYAPLQEAWLAPPGMPHPRSTFLLNAMTVSTQCLTLLSCRSCVNAASYGMNALLYLSCIMRGE